MGPGGGLNGDRSFPVTVHPTPQSLLSVPLGPLPSNVCRQADYSAFPLFLRIAAGCPERLTGRVAPWLPPRLDIRSSLGTVGLHWRLQLPPKTRPRSSPPPATSPPMSASQPCTSACALPMTAFFRFRSPGAECVLCHCVFVTALAFAPSLKYNHSRNTPSYPFLND